MSTWTKSRNRVVKMLTEPSTWRGLAILLGLFGVSVSPENADKIGMGAAGALGAIEFLRKEK